MSRWTLTTYQRFWSKVALPDDHGCMAWLASTDEYGYGKFSVNRVMQPAHRMSLVLTGGQPEDKSLHAAHSCRMRNCVAPDHLRWATAGENAADRKLDGTETIGERHGQSRLTAADVIDIRRRWSGDQKPRVVDLAREFGVSSTAISDVVHRKRWTWLVGGTS